MRRGWGRRYESFSAATSHRGSTIARRTEVDDHVAVFDPLAMPYDVPMRSLYSYTGGRARLAHFLHDHLLRGDWAAMRPYSSGGRAFAIWRRPGAVALFRVFSAISALHIFDYGPPRSSSATAASAGFFFRLISSRDFCLAAVASILPPSEWRLSMAAAIHDAAVESLFARDRGRDLQRSTVRL